MSLALSPYEIAELVSMARLLELLGFIVNERTHRAPCLLHGGSNPTAFSWQDDGPWHCFSCEAGGDRIALVRAATQCSFRESVAFLAALAGVEFGPSRMSREKVARKVQLRARAEVAAWRLVDEIGKYRRYYTDAMHRAERLQARIGDEILHPISERARDAAWQHLAQLASTCTFFFAAWHFISNATPAALVHFALAMPDEKRAMVLGESELQNAKLAA